MSQLCRRMQLDLIPLYPADLEAAEAETVREHVAACAACAAELAVYAAQTARLVAAREGRRAPKLDLWEGIRAELEAPAPRGKVIPFPGTISTARRARLVAACAAAVLLGSVLAYERLAAPPAVTPAPAPSVATGPRTAPAPGPAIARNSVAPARRVRPRLRTLFQDEDAVPFGNDGGVQFAGDREVIPLDEEATVPGQAGGFGHDEAEPAPRRSPETTPAGKKKKAALSESDSLSF